MTIRKIVSDDVTYYIREFEEQFSRSSATLFVIKSDEKWHVVYFNADLSVEIRMSLDKREDAEMHAEKQLIAEEI